MVICYPARVDIKYTETVDELAEKARKLDQEINMTGLTLSDANALAKFTLISQKSGIHQKIPDINAEKRTSAIRKGLELVTSEE